MQTPYRKIISVVKFGTEVWTLLQKRRQYILPITNTSSPPSGEPARFDILSISGCPSGCEHRIGAETSSTNSNSPSSLGTWARKARRTTGFLRFSKESKTHSYNCNGVKKYFPDSGAMICIL